MRGQKAYGVCRERHKAYVVRGQHDLMPTSLLNDLGIQIYLELLDSGEILIEGFVSLLSLSRVLENCGVTYYLPGG